MREKLSMDFGWRFHPGEPEQPEITEFNYYYNHTKAESARGPAAPSFYDMDWEVVDLPHDYGLDREPDPAYTSAFGFLRRCNAWYRRLFPLDREDEGKRIYIQFDGVATQCVVWVNGHLLHRNFTGYTSFTVDITDVAQYGGLLNQISVFIDTSQFEGWWYEGAGIYRHVWLVKTPAVAVEPWGTYVNPVRHEGRWSVETQIRIRNISDEQREVLVRSVILERETEHNGQEICAGRVDTGRLPAAGTDGPAVSRVKIPPREVVTVGQLIQITDPRLWDVDAPNLYSLDTKVLYGRQEDRCETVFGFRTFSFSPDKGFYLNERPLKLKGVCSHEDQANLGTALPDDIRLARMRRLKELGCNAYRCSHNMPAPETLDLCDRLGILVMDENRWFDSSVEGLRQLENMLLRDRNHPSIVLWSMANEEPLQACDRGRRIMSTMRAFTRRFDTTRPIMMAMHTGLMSGEATSASDVIGINYNEALYDEIHEKYPGIPLVASEIGGKLDELGVMGDASGEDWQAVNTRPFMAGMFKWAAYGYRGEARAWPRLFSRSGIIEADGTWKENSYFYKAMWSGEAFTKLFPEHWNLSGMEQETVEVRVYTSAEQVELLLNGVSIGRQKRDPYRRTLFRAPFEPGELMAISYVGGQEQSRDVVRTTGQPEALVLKADREELCGNRRDVVTLTVGVCDKEGQPVLWKECPVTFKVEGPVTVLAVQNCDPYEHLGPKVLERKLYRGACQIILRTQACPGQMRVTASGEGLKDVVYEAEITRAKLEPHVPTEFLTDSLVYFARMSGQN